MPPIYKDLQQMIVIQIKKFIHRFFAGEEFYKLR